MSRATLLLAALLAASGVSADLPQPTFYCSFDRGADADLSAGEGGSVTMAPDAILYEAAARTQAAGDRNLVPGKVGKARRFDAGLVYALRANLRPLKGTVMMWVQPTWEGTRDDLYTVFFGCRDWGLLYKYTTQDYITFGWIKADGHYDYGVTGDIKHWKPGQWHHIAVTYDAVGAKRRTLYLDGKRMGAGPIPSHRPCAPTFTVGAGTGGTNPARAALDELALFGHPLTDAQIADAYRLGAAARPLFADAASKPRAQSALAPPPAGPRPPLPPSVNWKLPDGPPLREWRQANQRTGRIATATRERVSLNGIWRFRPADATTWHYLRVPGSWHPRWGYTVRAAKGEAVKAIDGSPLAKAQTAWYERTFALPAGWEKHRLILGIDSVRAVGDVFLNGRPVGRALEFQRQQLDISRCAKPGENLLQIRVHALSPTSDVRGLDEDVWLERRPKGATLEWVDLHPLVADKQLEVVARVAGAARDAELVVQLLKPDGSPVHEGRAKAASGTVRFAFATPKLQPWHPGRPRLHLAKVSLRRGGKVLDELYPVRFGYRQLEVRGGDFYLNGHKFHIRGQAAPPFGRFGFNAVEANIRQWIGQMKAVHVNAVREYSGGWRTGDRSQWRELYYDIADEMGFIVLSFVPSNRSLMSEFHRPAVAELYRQRVADYVHRYGNHACTAMWFLNFNHGAHTGDIRPDLLDGRFDPAGLPHRRTHHAWMQFSERALRQADDSRPVFHHAAGNFGQVLTVMAYLGFGIPLAEREEWPSAWAATRFKPLMPVETGFPCLLSNYRERVGSLARVYASEQLTPEYFAAYAGDRVYANLAEEEVRLMNPGKGDRQGAMKRSANYDEQKGLFARWTLRAWRTWDMSGYCQHVEWRDCFRYAPATVPLPRTDPRHFGLRLDADEATVQRVAGLTRLGRVAMADNAPLLAYIAGPEREFLAKDHAFYAGEPVEKSLVLINDSPWPMKIVGRVEVKLGDALLHKQEFTEPVARGERRFLPLRFAAPKVAARTAGTITLTSRIFDTQLPTDTFAFECWPRPKPPATKGKIALLDGVGRTAAVLKKAGVATTDKLGADTRLLVIGRQALDDTARQTLMQWKVMERVAAGLNVLVFEQTGDTLAGMPMDGPNCRAAFVRAPEHPVLRGLSNADLRHWRGQSDLTKPYPRTPPDDLSWGEEFTRWSNRGVVCSFAPEKPQRGTFTVLADADFDLYLAPLVEWRVARGRIVFCQLDVTTRYGRDPVPTLLVHRLLDYLTQPAAGAAQSTVVLRGGKATAALAQTLALQAADDSTAMLVGQDWNGNVDEITAFAQHGGRVLVAGNRQQELLRRLFGSEAAAQEVFKASVPEPLAARGVAPGDFFWREPRRVPVLAKASADVVATTPAVVAVRRMGKGEVLWCGVAPADFADVRQVAKATRLLSVLLQASAARPDLTAAAPQVGKPDSPFAGRSLGFNPYRYRRW